MEPSRCLGLSAETRAKDRIVRYVRAQPLDRDRASQPDIETAVDLRHSSTAEEFTSVISTLSARRRLACRNMRSRIRGNVCGQVCTAPVLNTCGGRACAVVRIGWNHRFFALKETVMQCASTRRPTRRAEKRNWRPERGGLILCMKKALRVSRADF